MEDIEKREEKKKDFLLPGSILVAALLVSISLIYGAGKKSAENNLSADLNQNAQNSLIKTVSANVRPIDGNDHIFGNPEASVKIIEYSDLECPWCKNFHPVLKQTIAAYDGKVAWVYRHYPIDQLHPKARKEAEAAECANELGGNEKFWSYIDKIYEITPSNNGLDPAELPKIAADIGLDKNKFEACLESGKYAERVSSDISDAQKAGARGTPYSIVIAKNGKKYEIPGALPFDSTNSNQPTVKKIIDEALQ